MSDYSRGTLVILPRDAAKAFFGFREDGPRLEFLGEHLQGDASRVDCQGQWEALHEAFVAASESHPALPQCVLGGRPLHRGDDHHVTLVRPDVVRAVADQLQNASTEDWDTLTNLVSEIRDLYGAAAEQGAAVVFVSERPS